MLEVQNKNNQLVVDSRLIASELGISHKAFKETVRDNQKDIEEEFTLLLLETADGKPLPQGGFSNPETYYLLTEEQATYLMTLSKNTEQVKKAKLNLVKAFSKAKQTLSNINPELIQLLQDMTNKMNILTERTQRLDKAEQELSQYEDGKVENPGCANILLSEDDEELTSIDYLTKLGVDVNYRFVLSKTASHA